MKGILEINGDKLNVLYFNNGIHTEVDSTGRPWGMPKGGVFSITIPLTSNIGGLTRAALDDTLQVKGELLFYQWDMLKIASKLEFANAHVIQYSEHFNHDSSEPPLINIVFSPGIQRLNNEDIFEKPWNPSNPFAEAPVPEVQEGNPIIEDLFFTDLDGERIPNNELEFGESVYLVLKSINGVGKTVDIELDDNANDFKYKGGVLPDDVLKNFRITSNTQKIELEIVSQKK